MWHTGTTISPNQVGNAPISREYGVEENSVAATFVESDTDILEYLRSAGPATVSAIARHFSVTPTAVRQRLGRLVAEGFVERYLHREGRGRPPHLYRITGKGRLRVGSNYADLARALWQAVRKVRDEGVRMEILANLSDELTSTYLPQMRGVTITERLADLARIFNERRVPIAVVSPGAEGAQDQRASDGTGDPAAGASKGPVLVVGACPYPDLADVDPAICEFERTWLAALLGAPVTLKECRREGTPQCRFEIGPERKCTGAA